MLVLSVLAYIEVYNWTYAHQVCQSPYSLYFEAKPPVWGYQLFSWIAALIPALWLPLNVKRPSLVLFYALYFFTYIPATFLLYQVNYPVLQDSDATRLVLVLLLSMSLIQISYLVPTRDFPRSLLSRGKCMKLLVIITVCLVIALVIVFRSIMSFPDFTSTFDFRQTIDEFRSGTAFGPRVTGYAVLWTQGALLPFLMMVSLFRSKYVFAAILAGTYVLTYMMQGNRAALLDPLAILLVFFWLKRGLRNDAMRLVTVITGVLLLGSLLPLVSEIANFLYLSTIRFRLFESNVYNLALYFDFFQNNPLTHFTHVTGVDLLLPNPYADDARPLPFIISGTYFMQPWDANAGFWAQDGLGSLGLIGVPVISAICAAVLWIFDSITSKWNPCQVAVTLAVIAGAFLNVPLGTLILSGGLGVLMLIYWRFPHSVAANTHTR